jgi:hypothetical protein
VTDDHHFGYIHKIVPPLPPHAKKKKTPVILISLAKETAQQQ